MTDPANAPLRVLVVEDDTGVSSTLVDILREEGFEPECALNDKAAYDRLDSSWRSFQALVVDIDLGQGTTGYDVARYARDLSPRLPILYITGASPESVERFGVADGAMIAKPFEPALLVKTLREQMGKDAL